MDVTPSAVDLTLQCALLQASSGSLVSPQDCAAAKQQQRGAGIPVIVSAPGGGGGDVAATAELLASGIDGISVPLSGLPDLGAAASDDGSADSQEASVRSILGESLTVSLLLLRLERGNLN